MVKWTCWVCDRIRQLLQFDNFAAAGKSLVRQIGEKQHQDRARDPNREHVSGFGCRVDGVSEFGCTVSCFGYKDTSLIRNRPLPGLPQGPGHSPTVGF